MAHQHYKGTGQMHSFRGLLANDGQAKIRIEGATGEIAWRITKFQILTNNPGTQDFETIMKIYREEQDSVTAAVSFDDDELLGAATASGDATSNNYPTHTSIIFDNALFTRNIYVTHISILSPNPACNYYIELEEVKISAAGMAQLSVAAARRGYIPGT